jgi:SAM-dependent methyltransferase
MGSNEKRFVAYEAYKKLADEYAARVGTKPHNAYLEWPATISLIPEVEGKRVLDAGCGTGRYTRWLLDQGAEVVGFDGSPHMLEHARRKAWEADLRLHDLREPLDFLEGRSVDLVVATLVLGYVEDWGPVLGEFRRVLRDDGALVMSTEHPTLDFIKDFKMKDYWAVELTEILWTGFNKPVLVPGYRRPLQAITDALADAGFYIDRLVEARPTEDYKKADPEGYKDVKWRPSFLCIRAVLK